MSLFRIFRAPKPHKFDYNPRHWDPKKEEMQERLKEIERMRAGDPDAIKNKIADGFRRGSGSQKYISARTKANSRSNWLLLTIIAMLGILSYLLISVYLPDIIQYFEN